MAYVYIYRTRTPQINIDPMSWGFEDDMSQPTNGLRPEFRILVAFMLGIVGKKNSLWMLGIPKLLLGDMSAQKSQFIANRDLWKQHVFFWSI